MTRDQFDDLQPGQPVTVFNFGRHPGVVLGKNPKLTIQGRMITARGWVKVRTFSGLEWSGAFSLVDVAERRPRPRTIVPSPKRLAFGDGAR